MNLSSIPRNDLRAALEYCRERDWKISPSAAESLLMLQDDSHELIRMWLAEGVSTFDEPERS